MTWVPTGAGLVYMPDPSCTAQGGSTATPPPPSAPAPSAPIASVVPTPVAEDTTPAPSGGMLDDLLKTIGLRDEEPPATPTAPAAAAPAAGDDQASEEESQQSMPAGMAAAFAEMAKSMGFGGESSGKTGIQVTHTTDEYPVNPANGTCTLREAIQAANNDQPIDACPAGSGADTIHLGTSATYYAVKDELLVYSDITINGIAESTIDTLTEQPKRTTIMRAMGAPAKHRLFGVGPKGKLTLNQIAVANGHSDFGGGILVEEGELVAHDTVIAQNTATTGGGGIAVNSGTLTLTGCTIHKNNSLSSGGGVLAIDSRVHISKSRITNNRVTQSAGKKTLFGAGITGNSTGLLIEESTIADNDFVTASISGYGAGLHVSNPSLQGALTTIINSTIRNNTGATEGGGILAGFGARLHLVKSAITGHVVTGKGGGIHLGDQAELTATNATIGQNTAATGAGIGVSAAAAKLALLNNTIVENHDTGPFGGGGLSAPPEKKIPGTIQRNVLVGNTAGGIARDCKGFFTSGDANVIGTKPKICIIAPQENDQFGGTDTEPPITLASILAPVVHADEPGHTHYPLSQTGIKPPSIPKSGGPTICQSFSLCLEEETTVINGVSQTTCVQEAQPLQHDQLGKARTLCNPSSIEIAQGSTANAPLPSMPSADDIDQAMANAAKAMSGSASPSTDASPETAPTPAAATVSSAGLGSGTSAASAGTAVPTPVTPQGSTPSPVTTAPLVSAPAAAPDPDILAASSGQSAAEPTLPPETTAAATDVTKATGDTGGVPVSATPPASTPAAPESTESAAPPPVAAAPATADDRALDVPSADAHTAAEPAASEKPGAHAPEVTAAAPEETAPRAVQTAEEEESVAFMSDTAGVPVTGTPGDNTESLRDGAPAAIAALPAPALPTETTERLIAAAETGTIDHQTTAPHQVTAPPDSGMPAPALPSTPVDTGRAAAAPSADAPIVTLGESLPASVREQIEAGREDTAGGSTDTRGANAGTDATPETRTEPATGRTDTTVADAGKAISESRDTSGTARTGGGADISAERVREDSADTSAAAAGDCRSTLFARDRAPGILLAGMRELVGVVPVIRTRAPDTETAQPPAADGAVTETAAVDRSQDTRSADSSAPAEDAAPRTDAAARQLPPMEVYLFGRDGSRVTAQRVTTRQSETGTARTGTGTEEHPLVAAECTVTGGDGLRTVQTREDGTVWGHTAQQYVRLSTRDADAAAADDRAASVVDTAQECVIEVAAIPSSGTACDGTRKVEGIAGESPVIGLSSCSPTAQAGTTPEAPITLSFDLFDPAKPESGAGYANLVTLPKGLQNVQATILNHLVSDDRVRVQVAVASGSRESPDAHHFDCSLPLGTASGKPAVCTEAQASDIGAVLTDFTARMDTGEEEPSDIRFLFTDRGQLCGTRVASDDAEQTMDCIEVAGLPERVEAVAGASLERNVDGKRSRTNLLIGTRDGLRLARLQQGEAGLLDPAKETITMGCAQWREAPGAGTRFRNYRAVPVNLDRAGADDLIVISEAVDAEGQGAAGVGLMLLPNLNEPATVELQAEGSENPGPEGQPVTEYSFTAEVSDPTDDEVEQVTWEAVDATGKTVALNETEAGAVLTDAGQTLAYPVTVKATACDAAGACSTTTATVPGTGLGVDVAPPPPPIEDVAMVTEAGATNVATGGTSSDAGKTGVTEAGGESPAAPADGGGGGCSLILK